MAVRAVVASSAIRIFVMMVWVPGEIPGKVLGKIRQKTPAINKQALGRIVAAFKRELGFISKVQNPDAVLFMTHSDGHYKWERHCSLLFASCRTGWADARDVYRR
jgi:hypothetical protein